MRRRLRHLGICLLVVGGAMAALAAPAQAITHTGPANPFQLQANTRYCIGSSNTYAVLVKCSRSNAQKWYPSKNYLPDDTNPMFQQKSSILCLTADYYTRTPGSRLIVVTTRHPASTASRLSARSVTT